MFGSFALLLVGVFAGSTAVIFIRLSEVNAVMLAAYRCLIAAAALSPLFLIDLARHRAAYTRAHLARSVAPGVLLGIHFISWIYAARMTSAANCTLIVNLIPLAMPFAIFALARELPTRGELAGSAVAVAGVVVMAWGDLGGDSASFRGDLLSLGSMLFVCAYLALGRRNADFPTVWLYIVPLYLVAGVVCLVPGLAIAPPAGAPSLREAAVVLGLGLVPTVIGHSALNAALRRVGAQAVGVANLGQVLFAAVMAYFILDEVPRATTYVAGALIACGIVIALRSTARVEAARGVHAGRPDSVAPRA